MASVMSTQPSCGRRAIAANRNPCWLQPPRATPLGPSDLRPTGKRALLTMNLSVTGWFGLKRPALPAVFKPGARRGALLLENEEGRKEWRRETSRLSSFMFKHYFKPGPSYLVLPYMYFAALQYPFRQRPCRRGAQERERAPGQR
jgi:hypothetical protein